MNEYIPPCIHGVKAGEDCEACGAEPGSWQERLYERINALERELRERPVQFIAPSASAFQCCGAAEPPCTNFESSCQNPVNYPDRLRDAVEFALEVYDERNLPPEQRCYVDGIFPTAMEELRRILNETGNAPPSQGKAP